MIFLTYEETSKNYGAQKLSFPFKEWNPSGKGWEPMGLDTLLPGKESTFTLTSGQVADSFFSIASSLAITMSTPSRI